MGRTCAALARTCVRTVAQKLVFVDLGLQSFRVDCAQDCLSSVFVVQDSNPQRLFPLRSLPAIQCKQHTLDSTERIAGSATQLGHSLKEGKCMLRVPIHCFNRAAKDIRDSMARCLAGASRACAQLARGLGAACADFVVLVADCGSHDRRSFGFVWRLTEENTAPLQTSL